ncbi:related to transporter (major facilitator superfamily) [Cephalotrichum gorgonifer]|uniref:Related to transporter (Major facilitator superfamily) n=1 Tax=Cephalotrichum gorgonifer TaxID=2041049 RepID=A0AAE8MY62_9PEZI|nr:related to transporter (major facilitator superfamily) [Cephalotrichum gorgonifer]
MAVSKGRETSIRDNWKCILICLAMSMANCQYGYDTATISGFQAMVGFLQVYGYEDSESPTGWNIATVPQQLISSFLNVGTIVGVILTATWAKYYGRKPAIWLASLISFVAAGLQVGTTSLAGLYVGRILIGVSNGFFITFANVYTAEVSPAHLRGAIVSLFGIWVSIGSILGAVANNSTKDFLSKLSYQIPIASLFIIPTVLSVVIFFIPESPRWLLVQNRPDEAKRALEELRGDSFRGCRELLEEEFEEMKQGIQEEKDLGSRSSVRDMFRCTDLRRTLICFGVILTHSSSGLWLIIAYGTFFFQMAGVEKPFLTTIVKSVSGLVGVCVGIFLAQKFMGRRSMMLLGHSVSVLCMLGIAVADTVAPQSKGAGTAIVACALIYYAFYNGFSGALSWPISSELVSSRLRVLTIGSGTGINYVFAWLTSFTAPYFINKENLNWGARYAYIWAGSNLATLVFLYFFLPEMKGRTLEELDELFQNRVSVRDFPTYQCNSSERAKERARNTAEKVVESV